MIIILVMKINLKYVIMIQETMDGNKLGHIYKNGRFK